MKKYTFSSFVLFIIVIGSGLQCLASNPYIISGPMVTHADMRQVQVWLQVSEDAQCEIEYYLEDKPERKWKSKPYKSDASFGHTIHMIADSVLPGKKYSYAIVLNGKKIDFSYPLRFQVPALWQWRADPPDVSLALGSCFYINEKEFDRPGKEYGGDYSIVQEIAKKNPDIMMWLGDNVYLREADWTSRNGIIHRYTHTRSIPELQPLLASTHNYAIWDDHDYGPNDSDRGFSLKQDSRDIFAAFWGNPTYGNANNEGIYTTFQWSDIQFFLLDNRFFRSPNKRKTGERTILGNDQKQWLIDNLVSSTATFKILVMGGQFLNPIAKFENYSTYAEERKEIMQLLATEQVKGVIILSGDRHYSELSMIESKESGLQYPLYEFTVSPLTSGPFKSATSDDNNVLSVKGSALFERNFGMMNFTGIGKERSVEFLLYSKEGKKLWNKRVTAEEIGYAK